MYQELERNFSIDLILNQSQQLAITHFFCLLYCFQNTLKRNKIESFTKYFLLKDKERLEGFFQLIAHNDFSDAHPSQIDSDLEVIDTFIKSYLDKDKTNFNYKILNEDYPGELTSTLFYYVYINTKDKKYFNHFLRLYPDNIKDIIATCFVKIKDFVKKFGPIMPSYESVKALNELEKSCILFDRADQLNALFHERMILLKKLLNAEQRWYITYNQTNDKQ